jgi:hypothetical protein
MNSERVPTYVSKNDNENHPFLPNCHFTIKTAILQVLSNLFPLWDRSHPALRSVEGQLVDS